LLVGGIALPDDNLIGAAGEGHRHYVVKLGESYTQVTVGAPNHQHTLSLNAAGNLRPDFFLLFWAGSNADAVTIASDPNCWPIVQAAMSQDDEGNWIIGVLDNTQWDAGDQATWDARVLDFLGVEIPAQVDRGKRLVQVFLGALLSRQTSDERDYRYGGL